MFSFYLLAFFHSDFWRFSTEMATLQLASSCFLCSRVKCKVTSFFQNTNFKFLGEPLWVTQLQIGVHAWFNQWQLESLGYLITDPIQPEEAVTKERSSLSTVHSPPKMSAPGGLGYVLVIEKWTSWEAQEGGNICIPMVDLCWYLAEINEIQ